MAYVKLALVVFTHYHATSHVKTVMGVSSETAQMLKFVFVASWK